MIVRTEHEYGIVAWAIGGLTGYAVFLASGRQVGTPHKVVAVIAGLLGILLGKYSALGYFYNEDLSGLFEAEVFSYFVENFTAFFGFADLIFILLAVATAWELPNRLAGKQPTAPATANSDTGTGAAE